MKLLWTIVFSIIFLAHVRSQTIVGTWVSDWQNQGLSDPCPANFTITSDNTIQYGCSSENTCPDDHDGNLEQQTTNIFADVYSGYMFTYSPETNTVTFINDEYPQISLLYSVDGNTIPQTPALGTLGRTWTNKTQAIYPGNYGGCCVPDMIYVALTNPQYYLQAEFNAVFYYDTTTCSQTTTYNFQLSTTSPYNLTWDVTNSSAGISIVYAPASSKDDPSWYSDDSDIDWTFLISYLGECNYTYTPAIITSDLPVPTEANVNIVTWTQDWQTTPDKFSPTVYGVIQNNGKAPYTYMTTEISTFSQTILSYLVQTPEGQYFDPYLNKNGTTFTYNATTNTLLSISTNPDTEDALLLSPTGNLLNKTTFVNNWTNPITSAESSTCCIPSYIQITPDYSTLNQNRLSVEYYYPDGYSENEACNDFITNIEGGAFVDTVSVKIPSITQLTWTDSIGTQITWADPTNQTQLAVSIPGQCNLTMTMTSSPPPYTSSNPSTSPTSLSASWISSRVVGFIMGLFVMVNYI